MITEMFLTMWVLIFLEYIIAKIIWRKQIEKTKKGEK